MKTLVLSLAMLGFAAFGAAAQADCTGMSHQQTAEAPPPPPPPAPTS